MLALRAAIGGQVNGARGVFPGPGHSRNDRSLSVWDVGSRVVVHSFAGDPLDEIRAHLQAAGVAMPVREQPLTAKEARELARLRAAAAHEKAAEDQRRRAIALALWDAAMPLHGPAIAYLAGRGIAAIDPYADLRFLPRCPRKPYEMGCDRFAPAIAALVTSPYGERLGLHLTFFAEPKRFRLMLAPQAGGAVRLSQGADADDCLAIAEGIETALSFTALRGVPCWAARSALGLEQWRPPEHVRRVIIAADGDAPGLRAADVLAASLRSFVRVEIAAAPDGRDWNDELRGAP